MPDSNIDPNDSKKIQIPNWIWVVGIIIILVIGVGLYLRYKYVAPQSSSISGSTNEYHPSYSWGKATTLPDAGPAGFEFSVKKDNKGNLSLTPATLNSAVLSNPDGTNVIKGEPFPCIDIDQMNAIQVEHTCDQYPSGVPREQAGISNCITVDGQRAPPGSTEIYYAACNTAGVVNKTTMFCPGQVGGVAVNFNRDEKRVYSILYCLKKDINDNIAVSECNLADKDYQFRIVLTTPKSWPSYGTSYGSTGTTGTLAAFIHRATGLCVDVVDPTNKGSQGLTLRDCNETYNYGYTWQLFPPTNLTCVFMAPTGFGKDCNKYKTTYQSYQYDPSMPNGIGTSSAGCPLVGCLDAKSWIDTPISGVTDNSVFSYSTLSPQQIVYIGYANGAEQTFIPKTNTEIANFFYQYNGMSITSDGKTLSTKPFARWETYYGNNTTPQINNKIFNSQTASFLTYNFIYGSTYATPF